MTATVSTGSLLGPPDRHWLIEYVKLQRSSDKKVEAALLLALTYADEEIERLDAKQAVAASATVRKSQMLASRVVLLRVISNLFKDVGKTIRSDQAAAASLAADLLWADETALWRKFVPDDKTREELRDSMKTQAARGVQAMMTRILVTERPLAKRIYRSEAFAKNQLSKIINKHVVVGNSAVDMAKDVRAFINPNAPGGVSYRAKLLARTEINNAFHAQSIAEMQERPWITQARWNLSKSHGEEGCKCEVYAAIGLFSVGSIPGKPHPQCLCSITPDLPDLDTALKNFQAGMYAPYSPMDIRYSGT